MPWAEQIRGARREAGLSQRALAQRVGTSQATISDYERGRKQPSVAVLERLMGATGAHLRAVPDPRRRAALARAGEEFADALALAETLPFRRDATLSYPRLPVP